MDAGRNIRRISDDDVEPLALTLSSQLRLQAIPLPGPPRHEAPAHCPAATGERGRAYIHADAWSHWVIPSVMPTSRQLRCRCRRSRMLQFRGITARDLRCSTAAIQRFAIQALGSSVASVTVNAIPQKFPLADQLHDVIGRRAAGAYRSATARYCAACCWLAFAVYHCASNCSRDTLNTMLQQQPGIQRGAVSISHLPQAPARRSAGHPAQGVASDKWQVVRSKRLSGCLQRRTCHLPPLAVRACRGRMTGSGSRFSLIIFHIQFHFYIPDRAMRLRICGGYPNFRPDCFA